MILSNETILYPKMFSRAYLRSLDEEVFYLKLDMTVSNPAEKSLPQSAPDSKRLNTPRIPEILCGLHKHHHGDANRKYNLTLTPHEGDKAFRRFWEIVFKLRFVLQRALT